MTRQTNLSDTANAWPALPTKYEFREYVAKSPEELLCLAKGLYGQSFYFRGHGSAEWPLATTLERQYPAQTCQIEESRILYEFKRRAHHHLSHLPADSNDLEWLSILRHYGGPSRLLDFTRSVFVAAFLALIDAKCDAAIWGVNVSAIGSASMRFMYMHADTLSKHNGIMGFDIRRTGGQLHLANLPARTMSNYYHFDDCLAKAILPLAIHIPISCPGVFKYEPSKLNARMAAQRGVFLAPVNAAVGFEKNLSAMFELDWPLKGRKQKKGLKTVSIGDLYMNAAIVKVIIPKRSFSRFHTAFREMNLSYDIVFPDIEGLIRSLLPISSVWGFLGS